MTDPKGYDVGEGRISGRVLTRPRPSPSEGNSGVQVEPVAEYRIGARTREIRAMFSAIAESYDRLNHLLSWSADRFWRRRVVSLSLAAAREGMTARDEAAARENSVRPTPQQSPACRAQVGRVLDVCAGTGDLALAFLPRLEPGSLVVALDFSHEMLRLAREKFAARGWRGGHAADQEKERGEERGLREQGETEAGKIKNGRPSLALAEGDALALPFGDRGFDLASVAFGLRNFTDRQAGLREMARVVRRGGQVVVLEFGRPRSWWLRPLYAVYLQVVLPAVGFLLTRSAAYRYLARTVGGFASTREVCAWMRGAGLEKVTFKRLSGGIVVLYRGVVP